MRGCIFALSVNLSVATFSHWRRLGEIQTLSYNLKKQKFILFINQLLKVTICFAFSHWRRLGEIQTLSYNLKKTKIYTFYQSTVESYDLFCLLQREKVAERSEDGWGVNNWELKIDSWQLNSFLPKIIKTTRVILSEVRLRTKSKPVGLPSETKVGSRVVKVKQFRPRSRHFVSRSAFDSAYAPLRMTRTRNNWKLTVDSYFINPRANHVFGNGKIIDSYRIFVRFL